MLKPAAKLPTAKKPARRARARKKLDADSIHEIFARLAARNPEPRSELEYHDPYTLLVAVVLSAQATDVGVNRATARLFKLASTPRQMVALGEDSVREQIRTLGLFRAKAKHVIELSQKLIADFGGEVPHDREALQSLPGVGRKTANVVLNVAFGDKTLAVDTHIFRVSNRIPLAVGKTPDAVEQGLLKIVPAEFLQHAHHWLILHGRYICKARKPDCSNCPISDLCSFTEKTSTP